MVRKSGKRVNANELPVQELHKSVIKKFKRRKVYARFNDNIWEADLAQMGSLSFFKHAIKYFIMCHRRFHQIRSG